MSNALGPLTEVTFSFSTGGSERIAQVIAMHAMENGVSTTVCATHGGSGPISEQLRAEGIHCLPIQIGRGGRLGRALRLYRHLRRSRTTVLHVHHFNMLAIAYWPARIAGVKRIVVTEHSNYLLRTQSSARRIARRYGRRVDLTTVVHQGLADYLVNQIGLDARRVRVIPNGVDTLRFRPGEATALRQQLGIPPDVLLAGYVGRLHPDKDPMNLVQAISCLTPEQREGLRVVFIGDGACRDEMSRHIGEHDLDVTIELLGERQDIPALMQAMDAFVLPSRTEGLPVALLEAMSTGLPIVATDVGGVSGAVGEGGLIVPPRSPEALARALADLMDDQSKRVRLGEQSRRRAVDRFDRSHMFEGYMAALLPSEIAA